MERKKKQKTNPKQTCLVAFLHRHHDQSQFSRPRHFEIPFMAGNGDSRPINTVTLRSSPWTNSRLHQAANHLALSHVYILSDLEKLLKHHLNIWGDKKNQSVDGNSVPISTEINVTADKSSKAHLASPWPLKGLVYPRTHCCSFRYLCNHSCF